MKHEKAVVFYMKILFVSGVFMGGLEVFTYTRDHTSIYSIAIFTGLYFILLGSLFYIYFIVSKFETVEKVNKAMYFLGSFNVICMVIVQFMEFDMSDVVAYLISFFSVWIYSILNAELREKGDLESASD